MSDNSKLAYNFASYLKSLKFAVYKKFMLILINFLLIFILIYTLICTSLYFAQENLIFHPQKLASDFNLAKLFPNSTEINLETVDNIKLNSLFFGSLKAAEDKTNPQENLRLQNSEIQSQNSTSFPQNLQVSELKNLQNILENSKKDSKGLIFYLHGNSGSLAGWGSLAKFYNELGFDVLMPDYRGFGKSEGQITSQEQLFADNQLFYDFAKSIYPEDKITVIGFSIGTGMAAKLTQKNSPKQLILQAPYYSLYQVMRDNFLFVPDSLLKYKLETAKYLANYNIPITIFHGDKDETIFYSNSVKIEKKLNADFNTNSNLNYTTQTQTERKIPVRLITLPNQTHMGIEENEIYKKEIYQVLNE